MNLISLSLKINQIIMKKSVLMLALAMMGYGAFSQDMDAIGKMYNDKKYTEANYQILSNLNLTPKELDELSKETEDIYDSVINGDIDAIRIMLGDVARENEEQDLLSASTKLHKLLQLIKFCCDIHLNISFLNALLYVFISFSLYSLKIFDISSVC